MAVAEPRPSRMMADEEPQQNDAQAEMRRKIVAITFDTTLTEAEKAKKRQELMSGLWAKKPDPANTGKGDGAKGGAGEPPLQALARRLSAAAHSLCPNTLAS